VTKEAIVYIDDEGKIPPKPKREDYPDEIAWIRAFHAWKDSIYQAGNKAFDAPFRAALIR